MGSQDMRFSGEIFRKNFPIILSSNRHLATILPVRVFYQASDLKAGTVLGVYTSGPRLGMYDVYNDSTGASGLNAAVCVLFEDVATTDFVDSSDSQMYRGIFGGEVFYDKLTGIDAAAIVDLKARTFTDAAGPKILKF